MKNPDLRKIVPSLRGFSFPTRFAVEICAACNLACSMCHHPHMVRPKGRMPFELWKRCADQVAAASPATQCWFSFCGEPLLEPELLLRMVAYGRSVGLRSMNLNTNGMLLTPALADLLLESALASIVVGIDGMSSEVYGKVRIGGERDIVYANVEHLLARRNERSTGPEVMVQFIEMDENEHELAEVVSYWRDRGATLKVRKKLSWGGAFETPLTVPDEERIPCPWAVTMMHVFWDGRVPRCPGDTEGEEGAGNAWDEPLVALWDRLGAYRDRHLQHRFSELPDRCHRCKDWMTGAADRIPPARGPFAGPRAGRGS